MERSDSHVIAIDRLDIAEACTSMCWLADRREWRQLESVFFDDVLVDYTSLNCGEPAHLVPRDLVSGWETTLGALTATQHLIAGHQVSLETDTATCLANLQATHLGHTPDGEGMWTLGGHYRFDLVRTPQGWRICGVTMTVVWETGDRRVLTG